MDEINSSIYNSLHSGRYYRDARAWYFHKYVYPVIERSMLLLFVIAFAIGALVVCFCISRLYPNREQIPYLITLDDTITYVPVIKSVGKDDESPEYSISSYLAANYVKMREAYSYQDIEEQLTEMRNTSTKFVYKQFYNYISLENPDSPVLLYQRDSIRTIAIKSIFPSDENNIIVKFDATVKDLRTKKETVTTWLANVVFSMSNINTKLKEKVTFSFVVTDYSVQQVK